MISKERLYNRLQNQRARMRERYPEYEKKTLYVKGSESILSFKKSPQNLAEELMKYDVVSFDVFDTLVFRPLSEPTDLFFFLGDQLLYPDFKRIRIEMEQKARRKKYKKKKHYEVTLAEIYEKLSQETGIDAKTAMQMELELEYRNCFANPYMKKVVDILQKKGKQMMIISDMYLNAEQIKKILDICGYPAFSKYYVSSDCGKSKYKGTLYKWVKKQEGSKQSYAHVGDNRISDIQQAEKQGFKAFYYPNVNEVGNKYRPMDMSAITGGIYRGLINAHIHNGWEIHSREYEYGYIYGGLFVTGYCQFIHRYAAEHGVEKILFLARDGDVLKKVYEKMYPKEASRCEYIYWSRLAATKMGAGYFKYDYFRRFLYHKVNQKYTMKQILSVMELEDMLPGLCRALKITEDTVLTDKNVNKVKQYLMHLWSDVLSHYEEQLEAGKQYFEEKLTDSKRAVAVDIGWAGSGAIVLNYMVNEVWKMECEITGIVAGTNTFHNGEPDMSEPFLQSGKLVSYLYSQRKNRDIWRFHNPGKGHNLYWEMLLDAPMGSFKGFYFDEEGKYVCEFKEAKAATEKIREIQAGILGFAEQYNALFLPASSLQMIAGRDAYAPMVLAQSKVNNQFMKNIHGIMDEMNVE